MIRLCESIVWGYFSFSERLFTSETLKNDFFRGADKDGKAKYVALSNLT